MGREAVHVHTRDRIPDEPLDGCELGALLGRGQRDGVTTLTGPGGTPA